MTRIYSHVAGQTLKSHEAFLKKLTKKGATEVFSADVSDAIIVFCPIVSRYQIDIDSALSSVPVKDCTKLILVVMHHTFDKDYIYPKREQGGRVTLHVHCLFHEKKGLLKCSCNKKAVKMVRKELNLKKYSPKSFFKNKLK